MKSEFDVNETQNILDEETKPVLRESDRSISNNMHFDNYFSVDDEINNLKTCFLQNGVIYVFEGTFNFYRYKQHIENIKALGKSHVCIDFKYVKRHDIDF